MGLMPRAKVSLTGTRTRAPGWERVAAEPDKVERFLGDPGRIVRELPAALAYADTLLGLIAGDAELGRWREELFRISVLVDREHLLGCDLIARCRRVRSAEAGEYEGQQQVVDLLRADPPRFVRMVQDAADLGRAAAQVDAGRKPPAPLRVVTLSLGERRCTMQADGTQPLSFVKDHDHAVVALLAQKVLAGSPAEPVPFGALHEAIGENDPYRTVASPYLRQFVRRLNEKIEKALGELPHGEKYLVTTKGSGIGLSPLVEWRITDNLAKFLAPASVYGQPTNPHILQDTRPNRDQKLPARSRQRAPKSEDDPDD